MKETTKRIIALARFSGPDTKKSDPTPVAQRGQKTSTAAYAAMRGLVISCYKGRLGRCSARGNA